MRSEAGNQILNETYDASALTPTTEEPIQCVIDMAVEPDGPKRLPWFKTLLKGAGITVIEAASRGALSISLLAYGALYSVDVYAQLITLVGCQLLMFVLLPFGINSILSRLLVEKDSPGLGAVAGYLPKFVSINLIFAVPLTWALVTTTSTHGLHVSLVDVALVVASGTWNAIQKMRQDLCALAGATRRFALARGMGGITHLTIALALGMQHVPAIKAFFIAQLISFFVAGLCLRGAYETSPAASASITYGSVMRKSWVFGAWSICGWFSGYGASTLLIHTTTSVQITIYGQAISFISFTQVCLGGTATAILARLVRDKADWGPRVARQIRWFYDSMIIVFGLGGIFATLVRLERWRLLAKVGLHWPSAIWLYFFVTFAALTLYQRCVLQFQYDRHSELPWTVPLASESVALTGFWLGTLLWPQWPLIASAMLYVGRSFTTVITSSTGSRRRITEDFAALAVSAPLALVIYACLIRQH